MRNFTKFIRCFYYHMIRNELFLRAAALTYYAIFSIFPMLVLITTLLGIVLQDVDRQQAVIQAIINLMPDGTEIITDLLKSVVASRTVPSIIAVITLLWSATGFLRGLLSAIDLVHSREYTHSSFMMRGIGGIVLVLTVPALFLLLFLSTISSVLIEYLPVDLPYYLDYLLKVLANGTIVFVMATAVFFLMMHFIPSRRAPARVTFVSSLITALAWVLLGYGFSLYLSSGFAKFNVIYGSIGAVMALMLYLYLTNAVVLLGAQLNASLARFEECRTPYIAGFDEFLKFMRMPLPEINEEEQPPGKPTIAP